MSDYYATRNDLNYYNSKKDFRNSKFSTHVITFEIVLNYQCRRCKNIFYFNNFLYTHLKKTHHIERNLSKTFTNDNSNLSKSFVDRSLDFIKAFSLSIETLLMIIETYNAIAIDAINLSNITSKFFTNEKSFVDDRHVIIFSIDVFKEIKINYAYREYSHAKSKVALS